MALGQSFSFGVFLITITSFFHLDAPKYLESFLFLMKSSNSQCKEITKQVKKLIANMILENTMYIHFVHVLLYLIRIEYTES